MTDRAQFWKDSMVAWRHPAYSDSRYIQAMRDIREERGEWV